MWWTGRLRRMTGRDGIAIGMGLVGALLLMKGKPLVGVAPMILSGIYALWRFRNPPGPSPSIPARSSDMQVAEARALLGLGENSRSEEHTTELQSIMRNSYAVICLKKKT